MRYLEILEHEELTGIILSQTIITSVTVLYIYIYIFIHIYSYDKGTNVYKENTHTTYTLSTYGSFLAFYDYGV